MTRPLSIIGTIATVDISRPDEIVEGHYMTTNAAAAVLSASDVGCPFCRSAMNVITAERFGRIAMEIDRRRMSVRAIVQVLPDSHEALQCVADDCQAIMTRVRDGETTE